MKDNVKILLLILWFVPVAAHSQSVAYTKHNLSVRGAIENQSSSVQSMCEFCHTPHSIKPAIPSWTRSNPGTRYIMYDQMISSTSNIPADPSRQPDGSSILCLSCHDGTIALGSSQSAMPPGSSSILGTDLSDDHPISFIYDAALAASDGQLKYTPMFPASVDANSKIQCASCHDPHVDTYSDFLVASNEFSDLCFKCHDRTYWTLSAHSTSSASWNGSGTNPWAHNETSFSSVAQNGCGNCHVMHTAGGKPRLMKSALEEKNCLDCHNGNVASSEKNIEIQLTKPYRHDVFGYNQIHEPNESALITLPKKHVECADCHNPHAVNNSQADAPNANGLLAGVKGIDQNGNTIDPIQHEYELCFRCHSDNPVTSPTTSRQIEQSNTRLEFAATAASFHPIEIKGKNNSVPALVPPLTESSIIYCSDCHASNGTGAPSGPHGSIYPQILKYQYEKADNTPESAFAYELCYSCHTRNQYNTDMGNNVQRQIHYKHVVEEETPCNACHDPHGISNMQGNQVNNSHLINFDLSIVQPREGGALYFQDDGYQSGRCSLMCHGADHNSKNY
ncbi:MAG: cytochrome c3 family protein [Bacteroidota bacterium]